MSTRNRRARRAATRDPKPTCGWSIELTAYDASVGVALDPDLNQLPVEGARFCLAALVGGMVLDGAHRGFWGLPREWAGAPPAPAGVAEWRSFDAAGRTHFAVRIGKGHAMFSGPPEVARQLALSLLGGLRDGTATPTTSWDTGGYDERNLHPLARGGGVA